MPKQSSPLEGKHIYYYKCFKYGHVAGRHPKKNLHVEEAYENTRIEAEICDGTEANANLEIVRLHVIRRMNVVPKNKD